MDVSTLPTSCCPFLRFAVQQLSVEDYGPLLWPKLYNALDVIFQVNEGETIPLSYEEIYRY